MSFIILTSLAYILGIILAYFFIISYKIIFFILFFVIVLSISGIIFSWRHNFILILSGFIICGILIFNLNSLKISFNPLKIFTGKLAILNGQIIDFPQKREEQTSFILKINKINEQPQNSLIKVFLKSKEQLNFSYGDLISLKGILEDIPPPKFPGDFNYKKYLNYQGIKQIVYVKNSKDIKKNNHAKTNFILLLAYNWRENIIKNSLKLLPEAQSSELLSSIILGEKSNLPRELEKSFIVTGTLHLLAASGLNVAILILFCMTMGKLFNLSNKISSFIAIPIIIFYTLAAGADPSIVRAAIMGILALTALILNREKEIVHFIFLSALLILFFKPFWLFEVSFQLSYLAVLGIIYLAPLIEKKIYFLPKVIKTSLAISLGAQIFVSPLLAYYFNQLSLISLLANLILVPIAEILLPLGILMGNLGIIYLPLAYPLAFLNFLLIKILIKLLYILSSIPLAFIWIKTPSILFLIFYFISLILIIYFKGKKRIIFLTIFIFIIYGILNFIFTPKNLKVTFLDVSQGDSIFISFPYSKNLLIDTGNSALTKKVVIPYLHHLGISKLNYVLITHSHSDHAGGLKDILDNFSIEKVYSPLDEKIIQVLRANKINWQKAKQGSEIYLNSKIAIKILHPPLMPLFKTKNDLNNNSAVSQLNFQKINFLFAADIEKEGEDFLIKKISTLKSAVLKVPHQGSSTSCTLNFLKKIHPQYAVISVSKDNPYHHPSKDVLKRLNKQKIITYQTAKSGTIIFSSNGENIKIETMY